jgi:hypothetical protein
LTRTTRVCLPLAVAFALALAGCGETRIDAGKAEGLIRALVTERVGAKVATVACPEGITAKQGVTFECRVSGTDATKGNVVVTGRDSRGSVEVSAPFLHVRTAEADMAAQIADRLDERVKVSCPEIVAINKGATFRCGARSGDQTRIVHGRFLDDSGRFSFRRG